MAIKNSVSDDFLSVFVDGINVSGVVIDACLTDVLYCDG